MRRFLPVAGIALGVMLGGSALIDAQQSALRGQVRGMVVDPEGKGIPGVTVEMEFEGKPPKKLTLTTDKKGGFVRVGLPDGNFKFTFRKEGYKTGGCKMWISLGGLSEVPPQTLQPVTVGGPTEAGTAGAAPTGAPAGTGGAAAPNAASAGVKGEELVQLNARFASAVEATKAGRLDEAEALYREILTSAPGLSSAHYNLGYVMELRKDPASAASEYRKAMEADAAKSDSFLALARALANSGQRDEAVQVLTEAAAKFDQDAKSQLALGIQSFDLGLAEQAEAALKQAQTLEPTNPEPLYYLALLTLQKGQTAGAVALLEKYVVATGQNPDTLSAAKAMLAELKKPQPKR
jgi:Flp pilus assembly protein TadD